MDEGEGKFHSSASSTPPPPPSVSCSSPGQSPLPHPCRNKGQFQSLKKILSSRSNQSSSERSEGESRMRKEVDMSKMVHDQDQSEGEERGNGSQHDLYYTASVSLGATSQTSHLLHDERLQGLHHRSRIKSGRRRFLGGVEEREGKRRRISSNLSSPSSSFPWRMSANSSAPSRFLLTFLSSCHLVRVTSRLVVALAMTSLLLLLVHLVPGAYCSSASSTVAVYQSALAPPSSSSSSSAATKRAYFNQSLQHLPFLEAFQPLTSSTSSFPANLGGAHPQTWLNTRWPATPTKNSEVLHNKLHSSQLVSSSSVTSLTKRNSEQVDDNFNEYPSPNDNRQDNRQRNNINTIGINSSPVEVPAPGGGELIASAKLASNKIIATTNYDYYNNLNSNNNYGNNAANLNSQYSSYDESQSQSATANNSVDKPSKDNDKDNDKPMISSNSIRGGNANSEKIILSQRQRQSQSQGNTQPMPIIPMNPTGYEGILITSNQPEEVEDFTDGEIMEGTGRLVEGRASTAMDGMISTSANSGGGMGHNRTTKAERDNVANVSSTGVRPAMAFTNSYFGRGQSQSQTNGQGGRGKGMEGDFPGEDLYNGEIQSDQSEPSLLPALSDNNGEEILGGGVDGGGGDFYQSHIRSSWKEAGDGTIPFSPSQSASSHHLLLHKRRPSSSNPTAITRTTSTLSGEKRFKQIPSGSSIGISISSTAAGGERSSAASLPSTHQFLSSSPTLGQFHSKSIRASPSSSSALGSGSTASLHYANEDRTSRNVLPVVSSSKSTLSSNSHHHFRKQQQQQPHHHTHQHQQHQQDFSGNEVLTFGQDQYEHEDDPILVDEEALGENEDDEQVVEELLARKDNVLESNFIDNSPPPPSSSSKKSSSSSSNYFKSASKNGLLSPTASVKSTSKKPHSHSHEHEERMAGDDPSAVTPGKNKPSTGGFVSTTATTFGRARSPLQIRRDLSRLIASQQSGGARALNGEVSGSSLVGVDEEPMPNKCDRLFMSGGGPSNGTFESPTMISEEGHLYQCIFMFVSKPMERVEVVFQQFNVRGTPPECVHEWVDIWTEVEGTDPTDLVTTPFSGRYCGKIPPRRRISLYGGIAIGFYSDKNSTDESIFRGTFAFINDSESIPNWYTCAANPLQLHDTRGVKAEWGPDLPHVSRRNLSCSYKFIGIEGQRIRLEFRDFDVFYGGAHCPFDEVKVYDGMDPTSPLIGTYCGQQRNLVVFSSAHLMLVTFTTLDRSTEAQNRGFKGVWEFSESFVKLDFIEKNMGTHIRGTECDQRILSRGQSSGVVYSPNYPFPYVPKIVCRYFIYGLQDPQHLERVRLSFEKFDVITSINSEEDTTNQSDVKKCGDGFLKVYLKGQEVIQAYDKADYEFCGKEVPHDVVSDGPRLVLVFSSGEPVGSGFKARYQFETEYRVPGTAAPDGSCHFTYYSSSRMKGEFNSPRFPSNYPSMTNCTYIFFQQPNEQVRIVFDNFKMRSDKFNYTDRGAYGDLCEEDWVEVWNVISDADDRLVGRYCGSTAPGPIESREKASALKVILHTDDEGVSSGFKARYIYFTAKTIFGECGQNITQAQSGVLTSPKWPQKYDGPSKGEGSATCNWYLSVRPGSRVMLHFQNFAIEGEPNGRGCPAAAVRIWVDPDGVPVELCGESLMVENSQYVSARNLMRVTFITADKAVGAPGFRAVWTEVQETPRGSPCHHSYYRCDKSLFCIPGELRCDGVNNCGTNEGDNDMSDEELCGLEFGDMNTIIGIVVGVAISLLLIVLLCAWGQRRKRRRRRRLQLRRPPIHVCDNAGARFAAMDSV